MRMLRVVIIVYVYICVCIGLAQAAETKATISELSIPIEKGKIKVQGVVLRLAQQLGIEPSQSLLKIGSTKEIDAGIAVVGLQGLYHWTDGAISGGIDSDELIVRIDHDKFDATISETSLVDTQWLERAITMLVRRGQVYGLMFVSEGNQRTKLSELNNVPSHAVILVHGLDDPGFMWNDAIPALREQNYFVARFEYPNDGPIRANADLLATCLKQAKQAGIERVDFVGHSMGGLVVRDLLTRREYYNCDGVGNEEFPKVSRLIMVGTPNHGSQLARVRFVSEWHEHIYRAARGSGSRTSIDDGAGEAGQDLIPGSFFLRNLNSRQLAKNTNHTIIAGQWSPEWVEKFQSKTTDARVYSLVKNVVNGLGDGLVTIDSTRLKGVEDHVIVQGDHVGILFNVLPSDEPPPAIPIILDRLSRDHD